MKSVLEFAAAKAAGRKISMTTCYDAALARALEATAIDCLLVGDSAAMVMHGYPDTLAATVEMMAWHTAAVRRGAPTAFPDRRHALPLLPQGRACGPRRGGGPHAGGRTGDQARRRDRPRGRHHGTGRFRHSGHGSPRADAAVGPRARGLPRAGPHRRRRDADPGRREAQRGARLLRTRPRSRAGGARGTDHRIAAHPDHRRRRGSRLRRAGARAPGSAGPEFPGSSRNSCAPTSTARRSCATPSTDSIAT